MLKIALCDDRPEELEVLRDQVEEYARARPALELAVHAFSSASGVLDAGMDFDIFLLDILMPGLDGIELGRELRTRCPAAPILYLTVSRDFALESYRAEAMGYLVKPVPREAFFSAMDRAVGHCDQMSTRILLIPVKGGVRRIFCHELVWAEAAGRELHCHLLDGEVTSSERKRTFAQLWEALRTDGRFLLVRRGCLVNMDQIVFLGECQVELVGGQRISIPRRRRSLLPRLYLEHCHACPGTEAGAV